MSVIPYGPVGLDGPKDDKSRSKNLQRMRADGVQPIPPPSPILGRVAAGLLLVLYGVFQTVPRVIAGLAVPPRMGTLTLVNPRILEIVALRPGALATLRP